MEDSIELIRRLKKKDDVPAGPMKASMFYLSVELDAKFRAYVGQGNASPVVARLIQEFIDRCEQKGLLTKEDKAAMAAAAEKALRRKK